MGAHLSVHVPFFPASAVLHAFFVLASRPYLPVTSSAIALSRLVRPPLALALRGATSFSDRPGSRFGPSVTPQLPPRVVSTLRASLLIVGVTWLYPNVRTSGHLYRRFSCKKSMTSTVQVEKEALDIRLLALVAVKRRQSLRGGLMLIE